MSNKSEFESNKFADWHSVGQSTDGPNDQQRQWRHRSGELNKGVAPPAKSAHDEYLHSRRTHSDASRPVTRTGRGRMERAPRGMFECCDPFQQSTTVPDQGKAKRPDPTRKNALDFVMTLAQ